MRLPVRLQALDYILPGLLVTPLILDCLVGLYKGYPSQVTPLALFSALTGVYLANSIRKELASAITPVHPGQGLNSAEEPDPEEAENGRANARLNRMLGTAFLGLGFVLNLFWVLGILTATKQRVPNAPSSDFGRAVEIGIAILFSLIMAAMIFAGTKIYLLGRRVQIELPLD